MFNVLPDNVKKEIKREYKIRLIATSLTFIICLQLLFLIFLLPSWFLAVSKERDAMAQADSLSASVGSVSTAPAASVVADTNERLRLLSTVMVYPQMMPLVNTILTDRTSAIHLTSFLYKSSDPTSATLQVGGISATREALVAFVKSLQSSGSFKTVDLPVSDLAKDKDIQFTLDLNISP